jgi:uncharacterized protein YkwD
MRAIQHRRAWLLHALILVIVMIGVAAAVFLAGASPRAVAIPVSYDAQEIDLVRAINEYRASRGLKPLLVSDALSLSCDRHSSDMGRYRFVDHYTTGGSDWFDLGASPWDRMAAGHYDYRTEKGENLAAGYREAAAVLAGWKASPTHDAVVLDPEYVVVGVSLVQVEGSPFGWYWTADFGGYADPTARPVDEVALAGADRATADR